MGASRYIGRVGGLAVALGVGTAVATGYGVANADETSTSSSSSQASSASASGTSTSTNTATSTNTDTDDAAPAAAQPSTTPTATGSDDKPTGTTTTSGSVTSGVVSAQTNTGSSGSTASPTPKPTPTTEPDAEPTSEPDATVPEVPDSTPTPTPTPTTTKKPKPNTPAAVSSPAPTSTDTVTTDSGTTPEPKTVTPTVVKHAVEDPAPKVASLGVVSAAAASASPAGVTLVTVTPDAPVRQAPPNPLAVVSGVVSSVVNWMLTPFMGAGSTAPAEPPLAWSLLAFARREFDHFVDAVTGRATKTPATAVDATSVSLAAATAAFAKAAAVNLPGFPLPGAQLSPSTQFVQWVTGNYQTGDPLIADTLKRFGIDGTDVGVMWDNGMVDDPTTPYNEHQVLMAFGDTFSGANMTGNWRFNVLLRSADTDLSDGMTIPNGEWFNGNMFGGSPLSSPTTARQIIHPSGLPAGVTLIPTAGISIPTPGTQFGVTQYVNFMSVSKWGAAGTWSTNYSAIAYSTDNGENWTVAPTSVRYNSPVGGNDKFQQGAFVRPGDGYVYNYGTPNGRQGAAYVSRVAEKDILDTSKYEYYSKGKAGGWFGIGATPAGWYKNQPAKATAAFGQDTGACGVGKPGNQVSEMSVQYNKQLNKYVVLHGDQFNNIVMRTSDTPQGTWSSAKVLMAQQPGGIYAPMMHPWSSSTMGTGTDLYWNLSLWSEYNVMLMKTDLTKV